MSLGVSKLLEAFLAASGSPRAQRMTCDPQKWPGKAHLWSSIQLFLLRVWTKTRTKRRKRGDSMVPITAGSSREKKAAKVSAAGGLQIYAERISAPPRLRVLEQTPKGLIICPQKPALILLWHFKKDTTARGRLIFDCPSSGQTLARIRRSPLCPQQLPDAGAPARGPGSARGAKKEPLHAASPRTLSQ